MHDGNMRENFNIHDLFVTFINKKGNKQKDGTSVPPFIAIPLFLLLEINSSATADKVTHCSIFTALTEK